MGRGFTFSMALALLLPGLCSAAHAGAVFLQPGKGLSRE